MKWHTSDFLTGIFDVHCNNSWQYMNFMKELDRIQVRWGNGAKASEFRPYHDFPIYIRYNYRGNSILTYSLTQKLDKVLEMRDHIWTKEDTRTPKKYKVEIECDGTTTTAKLIVDGKEVKSATAKKHPDDKFNLKLGMETVFGRLWEKNKSETDTKRDFKVGDRVVYVGDKDSLSNQLKGMHGRIVKIISFEGKPIYGVDFDDSVMGKTPFPHDCDGTAHENHVKWCLKDHIVHEPPNEKIKPIKPWCKSPATGHPLRFHVGDRVVMNCSHPIYSPIKGWHGEIIHVCLEEGDKYEYQMQFDDCILGHNFYVSITNGKPGHCLWVNDAWLEPETT